jgi:tRNA (cytidine32/uridine32-2'-O)-methyltransferase
LLLFYYKRFFVDNTQLNNIRIVLVNTTHPGNIGGVARAMKNMGLRSLYLVEPKHYPHEEAVLRSGHAADILDGTLVTETLDEAIAGCGFVIGTSARERKIPWPLLNPRAAAAKACIEARAHPVAIVFGREDRGLTNEELQKCHLHLTIPTNDEYSSLNLAAAVQVVAYELRMTALGDGLASLPSTAAGHDDSRGVSVDEMSQWDAKIADAGQMALFFQHLEEVLVAIEYLDPEVPRQTMARLRRLYNRGRLDEMEVNMLRGILKSTQRMLPAR